MKEGPSVPPPPLRSRGERPLPRILFALQLATEDTELRRRSGRTNSEHAKLFRVGRREGGERGRLPYLQWAENGRRRKAGRGRPEMRVQQSPVDTAENLALTPGNAANSNTIQCAWSDGCEHELKGCRFGRPSL